MSDEGIKNLFHCAGKEQKVAVHAVQLAAQLHGTGQAFPLLTPFLNTSPTLPQASLVRRSTSCGRKWTSTPPRSGPFCTPRSSWAAMPGLRGGTGACVATESAQPWRPSLPCRTWCERCCLFSSPTQSIHHSVGVQHHSVRVALGCPCMPAPESGAPNWPHRCTALTKSRPGPNACLAPGHGLVSSRPLGGGGVSHVMSPGNCLCCQAASLTLILAV